MTTYTQTTGIAPLIDTHAHLDFVDYEEEREQVIGRAWDAGLVGIVTIGIEPKDWDKTLDIANGHEAVYSALGIHPNSADQTDEQSLEELVRLCRSSAKKVVALGETG